MRGCCVTLGHARSRDPTTARRPRRPARRRPRAGGGRPAGPGDRPASPRRPRAPRGAQRGPAPGRDAPPRPTHVLRALGEAGLLETDPAPGRGTGTVAVVDRGLGLAGLDRVLTGSGAAGRRGHATCPRCTSSAPPRRSRRGALDDWLGEGAPAPGAGRHRASRRTAARAARRARGHRLPALRRRPRGAARPAPPAGRRAAGRARGRAARPGAAGLGAGVGGARGGRLHVADAGRSPGRRPSTSTTQHRWCGGGSATRTAAAPGTCCRTRPSDAHQYSLSSLPSIARRCSREQVSQ